MNAGRLPASSRTAATKLVKVASLTAPCPIGMLRYSSPAATTASGVRNGRGSIASRMSITTAQPARFRAARCSDAGCPPVTIPGIGSQALGTPAMASRDRKSTRLNSSHDQISYAVFCLKKKKLEEVLSLIMERMLVIILLVLLLVILVLGWCDV